MDELGKMMGRNTDANFNTNYAGKKFANNPNSGVQYVEGDGIINDSDEENPDNYFDSGDKKRVSPFRVQESLSKTNSAGKKVKAFVPYKPRDPPPKTEREIAVLDTVKNSISKAMLEKMTFKQLTAKTKKILQQ